MYLRPELPAPPASANFAKAVTHWPMYGNDRYGDCTCAAAGHVIQAWRTNTGVSPRKPSTQQILTFYASFTTPGPENGIEVLRVLRRWHAAGLAGDRLGAYTTLNLSEPSEVKQSIALFGACYVGIVLPRFLMNAPDPLALRWDVPPQGRHGAGERDPNGGHAVPAFAYDEQHVYVVTWGALKAMTWAFYLAYADEAYALLGRDWLAHGRAPSGFDLAQLTTDLTAIRRE